jgi:hypothetical protein
MIAASVSSDDRSPPAASAARRQLEYVFYAVRDHHVRGLDTQPHRHSDKHPDTPAEAA